MSILKKAIEILNKDDPERQYGPLLESVKETALIASSILRTNITPEIVLVIYIAGKFNRESYKHKEDNLVDAVAYIEILNKLKQQYEAQNIKPEKRR